MSDSDNPTTPSGKEQRRALRIPVQIPVNFSIIIPEETFTSEQREGTMVNLSENGGMIEAVLPQHVYASLLHRVRYCRVEITEPPELATRVTGRAVWLHPKVRRGETVYQIGLYFDDIPDAVAEKFRRFIAEAATRRRG